MSRLLEPKLAFTAAMAAMLALFTPRTGIAEQIKLDVSLSHPFLQADAKQTAFLKVGMTGFAMASDSKRAPINVALVLDKSGSMSGEKIQKAKEAAIQFVERLGREDIVSVVAYDSTVRVLVPATKASDMSSIIAGINQLTADNSTALFAGVSKGAEEVRKFLDRNRVNTIVLLSDGLANVGPSSPADLAALGASLIKEGISVTTLGLGLDYNEDLMTQLAMKSDGNHGFVSSTEDLTKLFETEFGALVAVVAQEVRVNIICADGVRPVRVLGLESDVTGQTVITPVNQLYSNQERYVLLEVEVPPTSEGKTSEVATVSVSYANMMTKTTDVLTSTIGVRFTNSREKVAKETDAKVMSSAVEQIATKNNDLAVALRDQGKVEDARKLLEENAAYCDENARRFNSKDLEKLRDINEQDAQKLDPETWAKRRKQMRAEQLYRFNRPVDMLRN